MSQPQRQAPTPDEATVEAALVAACRHRRFDRSQAFASCAGSRGVRILAGAALKARSGCAATAIAPLLQLSGPELSPSMLARYAISTDDLLEVIEGLGAVEGGPAPTAPIAKVADERLSAGASPAFQPRERKQTKASSPKMVAARVAPLAPARIASSGPGRAVRLKPVSPDVARWAGFFLASPIWSPDEVAELFDVHPDALVDAVAGRLAA